MPWAKLDDGAWENLKLRRLSHAAFRLWVYGLAYCAAKLTDGVLPEDAIAFFPLTDKERKAAISELLREQVKGKKPLWEQQDDGYFYSAYFDGDIRNSTRDEVLTGRARHADAQRKSSGGKKKSGTDESVTNQKVVTEGAPSPSHLHEEEPAPPAASLTKADKAKGSPVKVLVDRYHDMLGKNLGVEKVDANWPKVATIFKRQLEEHGPKVVGPALTKFMADRDPFVVDSAWAIGLFSARFNRYIGRKSNDVEASDAAVEETKRKLQKQRDDVFAGNY